MHEAGNQNSAASIHQTAAKVPVLSGVAGSTLHGMGNLIRDFSRTQTGQFRSAVRYGVACLRKTLRLCGGRSFDALQFEFEDQQGPAGNSRARTLAVGEFR